MTGFVHLAVHTDFSLHDSLVNYEDLVETARAAGMPAVAMTDAGNLFGVVRFFKEALSAGVKPLLGAEINLSSQEGVGKITLLCRNNQGYENLMALLSEGYASHPQRENGGPLISEECLARFGRGLVLIDMGRKGAVGRLLLDKPAVAKSLMARLAGSVDRLTLGISRAQPELDEPHVQAALFLQASAPVPLCAINPVRFLKSADYDSHRVRLSIARGAPLSVIQADEAEYHGPGNYFRSADEMKALFADLPDALANTVAIARACSIDLKLGKNFLPHFAVPAGHTEATHLIAEAEAGLARRMEQLYPDAAGRAAELQTYQDRLAFEVGVINKMGFAGYFLIVADFIAWSKRNDIPVGPGRGSGAGSLVAYSLGITDLDPLRYGLLFERFLNPERVSMPDFDIDFCMDRRDEVIRYVAEKYGHESVSQIITFGTMAAKSVIRDVARALGQPYAVGDRISRLVPEELEMTLSKALQQSAELKFAYDTDAEVRDIVDHGLALEGLVRQVGKHAGGVLIAPGRLTEYTPTYQEQPGAALVSQYDKDDVESAGLVKFDFLGLRTLTVVHGAMKAINAERAKRGLTAIDINNIPIDDRKAFDLLCSCKTTAVFQLESRGMKALLNRLQPDTIEEIIALVALYRPGPIEAGMIDDFVNRKKGIAPIEYLHPSLEGLLRNTYGVWVYQEQVMSTAQVLAGYTLGQADLLRRAMGKKKAEEMAKQRAVFVSGAINNNVSAEVAGQIFDLMEKFAGYGFNKSHSAAYGFISYQTAWLKANYPAPYMASVLNSEVGNLDKLVVFMEEAKAMGLHIIAPNVNKSGKGFRADDNGDIVYGLSAIKSVGTGILEAIIAEREANGPFQDLVDLCRRCNPNKRVLEALIHGGALDVFGMSRMTMLSNLAMLQAAARQVRASVGQMTLFGGADETAALPIKKMQDTQFERLAGERNVLGHYATGHPMDQYRQMLVDDQIQRITDIVTAYQPAEVKQRKIPVQMAGLIVYKDVKDTQRGQIAIVRLDDKSGQIEVVLPVRVFHDTQSWLDLDMPLVVNGDLRFDERQNAWRVIANGAQSLDTNLQSQCKQLTVDLSDLMHPGQAIKELVDSLKACRDGQLKVAVAMREEGDLQLCEGSRRILPTKELLGKLQERIGEEFLTLSAALGAPEHLAGLPLSGTTLPIGDTSELQDDPVVIMQRAIEMASKEMGFPSLDTASLLEQALQKLDSQTDRFNRMRAGEEAAPF